ncbi:polyprenyl synthetase family protein [Exiguobacterium mexicanum]|uniref:polyprenyl synthetase family protein n=1 Tax=Exiguobacterium mexicanum TaxID=340146 RepID=UPI0037BFEC85
MSAHVYLQEWKQEVETATRRLIGEASMPERLFQSMMYSLEAGGKRIRPALLYAVLDTYGRPRALGHEAAVALEMVHTYSLIHDDLPAMDDDDVRRGRPTNHRQFDEATAILAGDALLTDAFRILAQAELEPAKSVALIARFSEAAGSAGMVGGSSMTCSPKNVLECRCRLCNRFMSGRRGHSSSTPLKRVRFWRTPR